MNAFLFGVFPYIAGTLFIVVPIIRRMRGGFTFTTRSSGFIERPMMGVAALCIHWGILILLVGHIIGLIGGLMTDMNWVNWFRYIGLLGGALALYGFSLALLRRISLPEMRAMSQIDDYVVLVLLIAIIAFGIYPVIADRSFGLSITVAPWVKSIFSLNPDWAGMAGLPFLSKLHITAGMLLFAYFPFTKLVHMWTVPLSYFTRPYSSMRTYRKVAS